jgi:hypothetical protein
VNEFEIGGRKFKCLKVNARKQYHIVRRIGPILGDLLPVMQKFAGKAKSIAEFNVVLSGLTEDEKLTKLAEFAGPIMTGLSKLNDADADYVLDGLLEAIEMQQATGNWIRVIQGTPSMLMVQDLEFPVMMQLAGKAFAHNMASFFTALPHP